MREPTLLPTARSARRHRALADDDDGCAECAACCTCIIVAIALVNLYLLSVCWSVISAQHVLQSNATAALERASHALRAQLATDTAAKTLVARLWDYSIESYDEMLQLELDVLLELDEASDGNGDGVVTFGARLPPFNASAWLRAADNYMPQPHLRAVTPTGDVAHGDHDTVLPVIVLCFNRASYLRTALDNLFVNIANASLHPVIVSQDGSNSAVAHVARSFPVAEHIMRTERRLPRKLSKGPGPQYYHIAAHYKFALTYAFDAHPEWDAVILLEEDLEIAPDFFEYFRATYPLLRADRTLMSVSAWNDNGEPEFAHDATRVYRTDFFPGLGWLCTRELWLELRNKWPIAFWDDWMREPEQRRGRSHLRPEMSRTHTFGRKGASKGQFFDQYLRKNALSHHFTPFSDYDLNFLLKPNFDRLMLRLRNMAEPRSFARATGGDCGNGLVKVQAETKKQFSLFAKKVRLLNVWQCVALHRSLAVQFGIMDDIKWEIPRTGYAGMVPFVKDDCAILLLMPRRST